MPQLKDRRVIFVVGAHRSGSSALTRALQVLGYTVPSGVLEANRFNPKGYFENETFVSINDQILASLGCAWWSGRVPSWLSRDKPELTALKATAVAFLQSCLSDHKKIALKDPRTSLTIPFWKAVASEVGIEFNLLLTHRTAADAIRSQIRRDNISVDQGAMIWVAHVLAAMAHGDSHVNAVADLSKIISDPQRTLEALALGIDGSLAIDETELREYTEQFLDRSLYTKSGDTDLGVSSPDLAQMVADLQSIVSQATSDKKILVDAPFEELMARWVALESEERLRSSVVEPAWSRINFLTAHCDQLEEEKAQLEGEKAQLEGEKAQLEGEKAQQQSEIISLDLRIGELDKTVFEMKDMLAAVEQRAEMLVSEVAALRSSFSWRLTAPIRLFLEVTLVPITRHLNWAMSKPTVATKIWAAVPVTVSAKERVCSKLRFTDSANNEIAGGAGFKKTVSQEAPGVAEKEPLSRDSLPRVPVRMPLLSASFERKSPVEPALTTIAFYLPQFHPFPENDKWWGKGFTEWTNVTKAQPLFKGHFQPQLPIHLGFYDLRLREVLVEQSRIAANYGVAGFCFHFYWFNGKVLMEEPIATFHKESEIDTQFCFCWANEPWTRRWDGQDHSVLMPQEHSLEDSKNFFTYIAKYFANPRYTRVADKPVLVIYRADLFSDMKAHINVWREQAKQMGFAGVHVVATTSFGYGRYEEDGFDAIVDFPPHSSRGSEINDKVEKLATNFEGKIYDYREVAEHAVKNNLSHGKKYPAVMMGWDNTARRGMSAHVFANFDLTVFQQWLEAAKFSVLRNSHLPAGEKLVFINAWNEWAEGTHLEPDQKFGFKYLDAVHAHLAYTSQGLWDQLQRSQDEPQHADRAVILHIYYEELYPEMLKVGKRFQGYSDIFVTTPSEALAARFLADLERPRVYLTENRGRDILPFIDVLRSMQVQGLNYEWVLKIHSKRSEYRSDGDVLRRNLIQPLVGYFEKSAPSRINSSAIPEEIGLLYATSSLKRHTAESMYFNQLNMRDVASRLNIELTSDAFIAGSMFIFRPSVFKKLQNVQDRVFGLESGIADGEMAHAIERLTMDLVTDAGLSSQAID